MNAPRTNGHGRDASANAGFWTSLRETPLSDAIRGQLTRSLNLDQVLADFALPETLQAFVLDVTKRTKLWRSEQVDVAKELAGHFRDGLDNGATPEHLIERFGDVQQSAKMIRRARIRCRPLHWQIRHYGMLAIALLFGVMVVSYGVLAVRFFTAEPTISRNYFAEINAEAKAIPEEERAWPFYRAALVKYEHFSTDRKNHWWDQQDVPPPTDSPRWRDLEKHIQNNGESIELVRQARSFPELGYVYGEAENRPYLAKLYGPASLSHKNEIPGPDDPLVNLLLSHSQEMRTLARLMQADWFLAVANEDGDRVAKDLASIVAIGEHSRGNGFLIEDLVALANFAIATARIADTLAEHSQLLTSQQLDELADRLTSFFGGGTLRPRLDRHRALVEDILQRAFSDDGTGDGRLTSEGVRLLDELAGATISKSESPLFSAQTLRQLSGPGMMALVGSRRENHAMTMRVFDQYVAERSGPLHTWQDSSFSSGIAELNESFVSKMKYSPALLILPGLKGAAFSGEHQTQFRDGVLTAIAAELYRRENERLPTTLDELVPKYLDEIPIDRLDGKPLKYAIKNDRPVIYSVGMDGEDNGGKMPIEFDDYVATWQWKEPHERAESTSTAGQGFDWILFPRYREQPDAAN